MTNEKGSNLRSNWIKEVYNMFRDVDEEFKDVRKEHGQLRIDFEKLDTRIRTRNKIFYAIFTIALTLVGLLLTYIMIKKL